MLPNPLNDSWRVHLEFRIQRDRYQLTDWSSGGGMGLYYLQSVEPDVPEVPNHFGYFDNFEGLGIFIKPTNNKRNYLNSRDVMIQGRSPNLKTLRV
jgi:hypothetical protein